MMRRRSLAAALILFLAACASGGRASARPESPTSPAASRDAAEGPESTGGRWYGYEGGLKDAEAAARSIEGAAQYWKKTEGSWSGADTSGTTGSYVAHSDGRWLRRLEVTVPGGTKGAYTYDEKGRLFHYSGERTRRTGRGRQARTEKTVVSVALDGRGTVSAARKTVNGRAQPLSREEVARIIEIERAARKGARHDG